MDSDKRGVSRAFFWRNRPDQVRDLDPVSAAPSPELNANANAKAPAGDARGAELGHASSAGASGAGADGEPRRAGQQGALT